MGTSSLDNIGHQVTHKNLINSSVAEQDSTAKLEILAFVACVLLTLTTLGWVLWHSRHGIDFTDESFYLVWISNPWIYSASVTQFGFVYHPVYQLVNGDISLLRQANIFITFGLAWCLCFLLFRSNIKKSDSIRGWANFRIVCISAVLATSSLLVLVYANYWLPTPSYNSLAFQALLLCGTGMLLADRDASLVSVAGWMLIGIAGWIAFMAKPTTAAALGLTVICYALIARKFRIWLIMVAAATATLLLLSSAWAIDGSLHAFIERLTIGISNAEKMASGHISLAILRIDRFSLAYKDKTVLVLATVCMLVAACFSLINQSKKRWMGVTIVLILCVYSFFVIFGFLKPNVAHKPFYGFMIWAPPIGGLLAALAMYPRYFLSSLNRRDLALAFSFVVFPHVYALGTTANYWITGATAATFWLLSGVALLGPMMVLNASLRMFLPLAAGAQVITVVLLYAAMDHPYRQIQSLHRNNEFVQSEVIESPLFLNTESANYLRELNRIAGESGFKSATPVIDLTGHYPGALYFIGAKSIGQAWLIGGYKGSEDLATAALDMVGCDELSIAWILSEPAGPRKLSSDILRRYGIDLENDYTDVGTLSSPRGSYPDSYNQVLYRPIRSPDEARIACEKMR